MSCSSSCGNKMCPCGIIGWFPRIAFGLVLAGYGVNHYRNLDSFVMMAKGAYSMSLLSSVAGVLAYIVPALMIVGGVLFAVRQLCCVAKTCIYGALFGVIGWAGLAVLVGDGATAGSMMPNIQNAAMLVVLYYVIKKMTCCSGACPTK